MNSKIKILNRIHKNVFCNIYEKSCYVFLCGGIDRSCIRDIVRIELEKNGVRVLYPEDLFLEILNKNKKKSGRNGKKHIYYSNQFLMMLINLSFLSGGKLLILAA